MTEPIPDLHNRSVGNIAAQLPGASAVFHRFGIEFCWGGHVSLADAVNHRSIDLAEVKDALNALDPTATSGTPQETDELINHIQTRYHDVHRQRHAVRQPQA